MELQYPSFLFLLVNAFLLLLVWKLFFYHRNSKANSRSSSSAGKPLPGPWGLPIIGNIHNLLGQPTHRVFRDLAGRYGPLLKLSLGEIDLVVASSPEAAAEIMKTHDINFSYRPEMLIGNILFYGGCDILFSNYGDYWRQLRKICTMELLSTRHVRSFRRLREDEGDVLVASIAASSAAGSVVNLKRELSALSNSVVCKAAFGRSCTQQQEFSPMITKVLEASSGLSVADIFPSLKFLGTLTGLRRKLEDIHRTLDRLLDDIINDHEVKAAMRKQTAGAEDVDEEDFMDVLLRLKNQDSDLGYSLTLDNIKAVVLDMFLAGTETSSTVVHWAMTELMLNPEIMSKVQAEVREVVGPGMKLEEKHIPELKYLNLIVKETLRLHMPAPLLSARLCKETCNVLGYTVPAGARVFVNAWAIGRDPKYWDDPESFRPERFDGNTSMDYKGSNFTYLPFGSGRRFCPGMLFGVVGTELPLAQLLYHFDWQLPNGIKPDQVDMTETSGINASKKVPLCLLAKPFFTEYPELYNQSVRIT